MAALWTYEVYVTASAAHRSPVVLPHGPDICLVIDLLDIYSFCLSSFLWNTKLQGGPSISIFSFRFNLD